MGKSWKKTAEAIHEFYIDEMLRGSLTLNLTSMSTRATAIIGEDIFEIKLNGFWKSQVIITDVNGTEILTAKPSKWYGSTLDVLHNNKSFTLQIRNNPMAEWVLFDGDDIMCSYGLDGTNGNTQIKIAGKSNTPLLYDFLLWYLFLPVAAEQAADNFTFNMVLQSQ